MIHDYTVIRKKNNSAGSLGCSKFEIDVHENYEYSFDGLIFYLWSQDDTYFFAQETLCNKY